MKYTKEILNIFENKPLDKLPILEWNDKYLGTTDYIDRITTDDVNYSIMRGIDRFNRTFFTFRFKIDGKLCVYTLFQRYTDDHNLWTFGHCYHHHFKVVLHHNNIEMFKKLVNGETLSGKMYNMTFNEIMLV